MQPGNSTSAKLLQVVCRYQGSSGCDRHHSGNRAGICGSGPGSRIVVHLTKWFPQTGNGSQPYGAAMCSSQLSPRTHARTHARTPANEAQRQGSKAKNSQTASSPATPKPNHSAEGSQCYTSYNPVRLFEKELAAIHLLVRVPVLPDRLAIFLLVHHLLGGDRECYSLVWFCCELHGVSEWHERE